MSASRSIQEITDSTLAEVGTVLEGKLNQQDIDAIAKVIEKGILESAVRMSDNCHGFTVRHSGPDADIAHKITEDIERRKAALLANLSGLR